MSGFSRTVWVPIVKLQYTGEEKIPVGPPAVWAFVSDPEKVARCLPDVVDVVVKDATHVDTVVQVAVGPVRGKFKMAMTLMPDPARQRIDSRCRAAASAAPST